MTKSTSSSENKSDTIIKNKAKLVKAIKSIIDTNGFDYLKNKPYDVYLSLVANNDRELAIKTLANLSTSMKESTPFQNIQIQSE